MKYRIFLFLSLAMIASAADAQTTNGVLPSAKSLQTKILTDRYDWSKTWTNLTVKRGACPPWGCRPSGSGSGVNVRVIDDAELAHIQVLERIHETDVPRLPTRPAFSNAFSVAIPPGLEAFRTAR